MNYTSLNEAYKIEHVKPLTYTGNILYSKQCIYCLHEDSTALIANDGGNFRKCSKCKKHFKANILNQPIANYKHSSEHLKSTH
jgi:hypothetical protein